MGDPAAVAGYYDRWGPLYDLVARRTPGIRSVRRRLVDGLDLDAGARVLEVGCGTGANLAYLHDAVGPGGTVVGLDLAGGALGRARRRADAGVHLLRGDAARPPVSDGFDAVLATFVVGMLDDPAGAVDEWCSRLVPGGRIALLDATTSDARLGGLLNPPFRAFVLATAPPGTRLRYDRSPAAVLGERVGAARSALADRTEVVTDETMAAGFLRATVGERPGTSARRQP